MFLVSFRCHLQGSSVPATPDRAELEERTRAEDEAEGHLQVKECKRRHFLFVCFGQQLTGPSSALSLITQKAFAL